MFWLAALWSLPAIVLPLGLACAAASARLGAVAHALFVRYGRPAEPTRAFAEPPSLAPLVLGALVVVALAAALGAARGTAVVVASLAVAAIAAAFARARLGGGLTGDAYGFAIVLAEVAGLSALAI